MIKIPLWNRSIIILVLCAITTACGFHLRGDYQLPPSLMSLHLNASDEFAPLTKNVRMQLLQHNVTLVAPSAETPTLQLGDEVITTRTLSLYENGQVAEYEMSFHVSVTVTRKDRNVERFTIQLHRDYQDNPLATLAKSRERELILSELRVRAADQILRQLATLN